jgi:hypothetical protein
VATYRNSGPRTTSLGGVCVIAPQDGDAIILGPPWECDTHPVPIDPANPKLGINTKGCIGLPHCQHCLANVKIDWRAYFPAYGISIRSGKRMARGQRFVLAVPTSCFSTLREFVSAEASAEGAIIRWRGIKARFRRAAYRELVAEIIGRVPEDGAFPAVFDPRPVVLRAWGDPSVVSVDRDYANGPTILEFDQSNDLAEGLASPPASAEIAAPSACAPSMKQAAARFGQLPEADQNRWVAKAKEIPGSAMLPATLLRDRAITLWLKKVSSDVG